jgi:mannose-1-phosphate guanylyltransferase
VFLWPGEKEQEPKRDATVMLPASVVDDTQKRTLWPGEKEQEPKRDATVMLPASVVDDTQKRTNRRGSHQT